MSEIDLFEDRFLPVYRAYVTEIPTHVDAAAVARAVAAQPARRSPWAMSSPMGSIRALVWVALVALLMLALAAGAAVGLGILQPPRSPLAPTGAVVLNGGADVYSQLVADGTGMLWANAQGGLLRLDTAGDTTTSWTVADDATFNATFIAPSRAVGVWLVSGTSIRHFDGGAFGPQLNAVEAPQAVAEAADGKLWAAFDGGHVAYWTGARWHAIPPAYSTPAGTFTTGLAVDDEGAVWISWVVYPGPDSGGLARFDGQQWTQFGRERPLNNAPIGSLAELSSTDVWAASDASLFHFDGAQWVAASGSGYAGFAPSFARASDGTLWVTFSTATGATRVLSFDGLSWAARDPEGDLVSPGLIGVSLAANADGIFAATSDGVGELVDGRWSRLTPVASAPDLATLMLAPSANELWVVVDTVWSGGSSALWHYRDGVWTQEAVDPRQHDAVPSSMALSPDGTAWAVGDFGLAYRADSGWLIVDHTPAVKLAFENDRTIWLLGQMNGSAWGTTPAWKEVFDGRAWARVPLDAAPIGAHSLVPDGAGGAWAGGDNGWSVVGLARFDGSQWQTITSEGGASISVVAMTLQPSGDLMVVKECGSATDWYMRCIVRLAGSSWTTLATIEDGRNFTVAPDGALWVASEIGPSRFNGTSFAAPNSAMFPAAESNRFFWTYTVSPDGSVFGASPGVIVRLP